MVDLSFLEKFTKGNKRKMKRYINLYLSSAPETFRNIERHLQSGNWEQLRIQAHSLKPQADYVGIESLKTTLVEMEDAVKNSEYELLPFLVDRARGIHAEAEFPLKGFLGEL